MLGRLLRWKKSSSRPPPPEVPRAERFRLGDAENAHARQRLRIFGEAAVGADDEDAAQLIGVADADFVNARVVGARGLVGALHQVDLRQHVSFRRRQRHRIKIVRRLVGQSDDGLLGRAAGDEGRGPGGVQDALRREIVGVGIAGAFARQHAHAAADGNALGRRLHHALVEGNRGRGLIFEVEVGVVATGGKRRRQIALNVGLRHSVPIEEKLVVHNHTQLDALTLWKGAKVPADGQGARLKMELVPDLLIITRRCVCR